MKKFLSAVVAVCIMFFVMAVIATLITEPEYIGNIAKKAFKKVKKSDQKPVFVMKVEMFSDYHDRPRYYINYSNDNGFTWDRLQYFEDYRASAGGVAMLDSYRYKDEAIETAKQFHSYEEIESYASQQRALFDSVSNILNSTTTIR